MCVKALSAHFLRGGHPNACRMRAGEGRGSKKAKNCVRTLCMATYLKLKDNLPVNSRILLMLNSRTQRYNFILCFLHILILKVLFPQCDRLPGPDFFHEHHGGEEKSQPGVPHPHRLCLDHHCRETQHAIPSVCRILTQAPKRLPP